MASSRALVASAAAPLSKTKTVLAPASRSCSDIHVKAGFTEYHRARFPQHQCCHYIRRGSDGKDTDTDKHGAIRASGINRISLIPRANLAPVEHPAAVIL